MPARIEKEQGGLYVVRVEGLARGDKILMPVLGERAARIPMRYSHFYVLRESEYVLHASENRIAEEGIFLMRHDIDAPEPAKLYRRTVLICVAQRRGKAIRTIRRLERELELVETSIGPRSAIVAEHQILAAIVDAQTL